MQITVAIRPEAGRLFYQTKVLIDTLVSNFFTRSYPAEEHYITEPKDGFKLS
jgi:hypothetical protein